MRDIQNHEGIISKFEDVIGFGGRERNDTLWPCSSLGKVRAPLLWVAISLSFKERGVVDVKK